MPFFQAVKRSPSSGSTGGCSETFEQLDELFVTLGVGVGRS
jgi:hypothetical protein